MANLRCGLHDSLADHRRKRDVRAIHELPLHFRVFVQRAFVKQKINHSEGFVVFILP